MSSSTQSSGCQTGTLLVIFADNGITVLRNIVFRNSTTFSLSPSTTEATLLFAVVRLSFKVGPIFGTAISSRPPPPLYRDRLGG